MRRVLFAVATLLLAAAPFLVAEQTRPNFSGTWTFVPPARPVTPAGPGAASVTGSNWSGDPVTITQDAATIAIEYVSRSRAHAPVKLVYNLDESERTNVDRNTLPGKEQRLARAAWRGAQLVLTTVSPIVDGKPTPDSVETTEVLSLETPSTFLIEVTRRSVRQTDSRVLTYQRREGR